MRYGAVEQQLTGADPRPLCPPLLPSVPTLNCSALRPVRRTRGGYVCAGMLRA
jgi:hypothetical protein